MRRNERQRIQLTNRLTWSRRWGPLHYARALETQGRIAEAEEEYEELRKYYTGFEARTRYGLLLLRRGEPDKARLLFQDVVKAAGTRRLITTEVDRDWLKVAKANL